MELVSLQLPADPQAGDCYQASACVAPLSVTRRNSTAALRTSGPSYEVVSAEAARSVWYWVAPADWFLKDGDGDILGLVLQLQMGMHAAAADSRISEGVPEEETSEAAAAARDRREDVVFYHSSGSAVMLSLDMMPVGPVAHSFSYWIRCEYEEGKWFRHDSWRRNEDSGDSGTAAPKELVEHVLRDVAWLVIRGVYQAVQVGSSFVDPETIGSQGNAVGVVHVTQTALRGASLVQIGDLAIDLVRVWPMSGPVTGNSIVSMQGSHLRALLDIPTSSGSPLGVEHVPVCLWKCAPTESDQTSVLTILNDTHARCSTPWRAAVASCSFGVGFLVETLAVLSAAFEHPFVFYVPPALSAIQPSQGLAAGGTVLTVFGSGFQQQRQDASLLAAADVPRCRLQLTCTGGGGAAVQVALMADASPHASMPTTYMTCALPPAPCAGPASLAFALNGVDFVHHLADCPDGRRARAPFRGSPSLRRAPDGCLFEFVGDAGAPFPPPPAAAHNPGDSAGSTGGGVGEGGRSGGVSAGGAVAAVVGVLAYVYLARCVTLLAERRRYVRQDNGSSEPYSLSEAYVLWFVFGPLGAHRWPSTC